MSSAPISDADRVRGDDSILQRMLQQRRENTTKLDELGNWIDGAAKKTEEDLKELTTTNELK